MEGIKEVRQAIIHQNTEKIDPIVDLVPYKRIFMDVAKKCTGGRFDVNERNKNIVNDLFLYFLRQPGNLDIRKGLWLEGPVGTGKSTLMYVFSRFMQFLGEGFRVYVCSQVTTEYSLHGELDSYLENKFGRYGPVPMCFDELGREPNPAKYFGTELNVMQHILHIRYSYWQLHGLKTYITTNLDAERVGGLYGDYIRDRRKEMFNKIVLDGTSRR